MKTKIYRFLVLLILPVIYYIMVSGFHKTGGTENRITSPAMTVTVPKDFINFILNADYQIGNTTNNCSSYPWQLENHIDEYGPVQLGGELNFNGAALYDGDSGSCWLGWFNKNPDENQLPKMRSLIDAAHQNGLKAIFERSNISNLCYAQRLVYEVAPGGGSTTVNDGFCYQICRGNYEVEQDGTDAIHACVNPQQCNIENWDGMPQNICEGIYENLQHTDLPGFRPQLRDMWDWHLKPRMKIRQQDFNINDTRPVVSIIPVRFDGTEMDTIIIRVNNFRDGNQYNGQYTEKYTFEQNIDSLWVSGGKTDGLNKGRNDDWEHWPSTCHVDFKIHWEGNVDVWFDKLTVDDYRANKLFEHLYDARIAYETTLPIFLYTASLIKERKFNESNVMALNYVMTVIYYKLRNQAQPITLK